MEMVEEGQSQVKVSPKLISFQKIVEKGEDRISALPDCLLIEILSRLPSTKDAIRTGTLSKRWKSLWTSVTTLIFKTPTQCIQNPKSISDFVSCVAKTLTQCRQLKLKKLVIKTNYHIRFIWQFHSWIRYAISCNVEELDLKFSYGGEAGFVLNQLFFSSSCFTNLRLSGCILNPTVPICWKNLRSLRIFEGKLDEDSLKNILSGSPVLETLELGDCYGYKRLDITSNSIKNLVFSGYYDQEDEHDDIIEINAPNILSLTIQGVLSLWKILLGNVSSLFEVKLDYIKLRYGERMREEAQEEMLKEFILKLSHVKELKIGYFCSKVVSRLEDKGFIFPSNVKFPDDNCNWSDIDSATSESPDIPMEMVEEEQSQVNVSPELIKFQKIVEKGEEDRISALPDCLLLEILARLPTTKGAIRTGTLSKRWKHIWTLVPVLIFTYRDGNHPLSDFVSLVDKTLAQCRQVKLKTLRLTTHCDIQFQSHFNNWIRYAMSRNVEQLGICFVKNKFMFDQNFYINSCFTGLGLNDCILNPSGAISWKNLRSLRLAYMYLDEDLIENILSGSPLLEDLVLESCYGYRQLDITSKSVKFFMLSRYPHIKVEDDEAGGIIRINAPNILSLVIWDDLILRKLLLLNVSSLIEADLDYVLEDYSKPICKEEEEEVLKGLILSLRHVKELKIGSFCSRVLPRLEAKGFDFPPNVKFPDVIWYESDNDSVESEEDP